MPSICLVHKDLATIDRGGVCHLLKTIAEGLVENGWNVYTITTQDLSMNGVTTIKIPLTKDYDKHFKNVTEIINSVKPDIAECSTWRYELIDFARTRSDKNTKIVLRCDPPASSLFENVEMLSNFEKELYQLADARIAVSQFAKDELLKKYGDKEIYLVYNGIKEIPISELEKIEIISQLEEINMIDKTGIVKNNLPIKDFIDTKRKNVMWIGKPTRMKGFDFLERIVERGSDKFNFIINTGYSGVEHDWSSTNYNKARFIRGMDKKEQLALLRRMDIGISTSRGEGFGLVVSEELSVGLPVVLNSECEVFKEFTPNPAVTLARAEDPDTFLSAMEHTISKSDSSRNPEKFTQKELVNGSINVYKKILENN